MKKALLFSIFIVFLSFNIDLKSFEYEESGSIIPTKLYLIWQEALRDNGFEGKTAHLIARRYAKSMIYPDSNSLKRASRMTHFQNSLISIGYNRPTAQTKSLQLIEFHHQFGDQYVIEKERQLYPRYLEEELSTAHLKAIHAQKDYPETPSYEDNRDLILSKDSVNYLEIPEYVNACLTKHYNAQQSKLDKNKAFILKSIKLINPKNMNPDFKDSQKLEELNIDSQILNLVISKILSVKQHSKSIKFSEQTIEPIL